MTDTVSAALPDPTDPAALLASEGLHPVEAAYSHVLRIESAMTFLPLAIAASVFDAVLIRHIGGPYGVLTIASWIAALLAISTFPSRRVARWGYAMGNDQLRVARGWLVRTDTIVPFVRVQHIDVGQGPVERWFGLSHLVVHTSGTHNSMVTLPGLTADHAAEMRETIRHQIQSDFA